MGIWCYNYDYGNYMNGCVINFQTKKDAIQHALKNHNKGVNIEEDIYYLKNGEIEDIYTGE